MKRALALITTLVLCSAAARGQAPVTISLAHTSPSEQQTKAQLERLLGVPDGA